MGVEEGLEDLDIAIEEEEDVKHDDDILGEVEAHERYKGHHLQQVDQPPHRLKRPIHAPDHNHVKYESK